MNYIKESFFIQSEDYNSPWMVRGVFLRFDRP
jgi:hypothetical protein